MSDAQLRQLAASQTRVSTDRDLAKVAASQVIPTDPQLTKIAAGQGSGEQSAALRKLAASQR